METPKNNFIDELLTRYNIFLISMLGSELSRQYIEMAEQWGLGRQGQNVLFALHGLTRRGKISQKQLANFVGIDPRNLVSIIDTLEKSGMVKRLPNPKDRRGYHIQPTAEGKAKAKQMVKFREKLEQATTANLSESEKVMLHTLLMKLWEHSETAKVFRAHSVSHDGRG